MDVLSGNIQSAPRKIQRKRRENRTERWCSQPLQSMMTRLLNPIQEFCESVLKPLVTQTQPVQKELHSRNGRSHRSRLCDIFFFRDLIDQHGTGYKEQRNGRESVQNEGKVPAEKEPPLGGGEAAERKRDRIYKADIFPLGRILSYDSDRLSNLAKVIQLISARISI